MCSTIICFPVIFALTYCYLTDRPVYRTTLIIVILETHLLVKYNMYYIHCDFEKFLRTNKTSNVSAQ